MLCGIHTPKQLTCNSAYWFSKAILYLLIFTPTSKAADTLCLYIKCLKNFFLQCTNILAQPVVRLQIVDMVSVTSIFLPSELHD